MHVRVRQPPLTTSIKTSTRLPRPRVHSLCSAYTRCLYNYVGIASHCSFFSLAVKLALATGWLLPRNSLAPRTRCRQGWLQTTDQGTRQGLSVRIECVRTSYNPNKKINKIVSRMRRCCSRTSESPDGIEYCRVTYHQLCIAERQAGIVWHSMAWYGMLAYFVDITYQIITREERASSACSTRPHQGRGAFTLLWCVPNAGRSWHVWYARYYTAFYYATRKNRMAIFL